MKSDILSFRNKDLIKKIVNKIQEYKGPKVKLMEVCGTHTMAISKFGIREVLPETISLYSGPGCPVCVTPSFYIKAAIELSRMKDVIITTFGDMMRVPYDGNNLLNEKANGADIRIVYAPMDSLDIAKENPHKKVVFLSVGFETTIPVIASSVIEANNQGIKNYYLLTANKTIPNALKVLSSDKEIGIDGYIYPGHVSSILGTSLYHQVAKEFSIPGVVTGFEAVDILTAIDILCENINNHRQNVVNLYSRVVRDEGNAKARQIMNDVFEPEDAVWRGIGTIPDSGMKLRPQYSNMDAWNFLEKKVFEDIKENPGCKCGEILKGKFLPRDCQLFGKVCVPENPVGSCMVSSEGTCAAYYRYC
jgi:hydrogenase expression/formation protein HypD